MANQQEAECLQNLGHLSFQKGEYSTAAQHCEHAALLYDGEGESLLALEMWKNCRVAHLKAGDLQEALEVVKGSDKVFAEAGLPCIQAMALGNQAVALESLRHYEQALDLYQQANQILKDCGDMELRFTIVGAVASLQFDRAPVGSSGFNRNDFILTTRVVCTPAGPQEAAQQRHQIAGLVA